MRRLIDLVQQAAVIAVGGYLALVGATVSIPWLEGLAMGVAP